MNIIEAIDDRHLFGSLFKDPGTWSSWRVFLKAVFALPMTPAELEIYKNCTGRSTPPARPLSEAFSIVGRRGGKSFISAIVACYLALFHDWTPYLAPGETAWILVIATDRPQAKNILGYIKGILQASQLFKNMIEKDLTWEINLTNQVGVKVATCDYRTLRGYTVAGAVLDELAYWRSEGSNPAQEILTALRPALATIPGSLLLGISSPYGKIGPLFEVFQEKYGQEDEDVLVWKAATKTMNPTIKDRVIERAMKNDYAAAKSEWLAEFREDLASYIPPEVIDSLIVPGRHELPKIEGVSYSAFVDPAGGAGKDAMTLAVFHSETETGRLIQDCLRVQRPPFNPKQCVKEFALALKSYGLNRVEGDRYSGDWCASTFREEGIQYENSAKSKSEIYLELLPLLMQGRIELLDHRQTIAELKQLERMTGRGRDVVDHPTNLHDDCANAVAGACVKAQQPAAGMHIWRLGSPEPGASVEEQTLSRLERDSRYRVLS